MADSVRFLSSFCYLLCFCFLFFSFYSYESCVYGARELANDHRVHNRNSHTPAASKCSASTKGLQIAHRYGPCSPLGQKNPPPTTREILLQDQSRVRSLYSKSSNDESGTGVELPLEGKHAEGNFVVKVGFGTPKRDLTLMFDTGSSTTWIQCKPCPNCFPLAESIFDPSQSSTFSNNPSCRTPTSTCPPYSVVYHDQSYSSGYYAQDKLTLSSNTVFSEFVFGCAQNNSKGFGQVAGVLGLAPGDTSIMSQTFNSFGQQFCYCLPLQETSTGFLRFGLEAFITCKPEISVPLITVSDSYLVNLVGITIGQKRLEMSSNSVSGSSPSTMIDSGTIMSRLPGSVYSQLRSSFQELMSEYPTAQADVLLDTCYDLSGYDADINEIVPSMTLHFGGSKDLTLDPYAVAWEESKSRKVCLAFAGNKNSDDLTIIGNHQQRNLKISYSVLDKQVGFSTGGCGN